MDGRGSRRRQIIASAAASFAGKGVAATTVRQIADDVGILSGSIYHHFESKEAIVEAIIGPYLDDLRERYRVALAETTDPAGQLQNLVRASLQTAADHPYATEIYQNAWRYLRDLDRFAALREVGHEVQAMWLTVIRAGMASGVFSSDVDARITYRLIRDAVWTRVHWFRPTAEHPVARLAEECTTVFLHGLTGPGRGRGVF